MAARTTTQAFGEVLAAIDVGTNAVRLELARALPDGNLEVLHQERDPVRPGEGLFTTGMIQPEVAARLMSTLRRYAALCRRYHAKVRAVATSAVREAQNRDDIVKRARREAGLNLEVVSGKEEARLICLGVLHGKPASARSLCVDIGGGSTEVASALGEEPRELWSIALGAVRLTELFHSNNSIDAQRLTLMRHYAEEGIREALPRRIVGAPKVALGSSGTIQAVLSFAAEAGSTHATARQISRAVDKLAALESAKRRRRFDARRAEIVVAGAVVLEAVVNHLSLEAVIAVDKGLRDGLLLDLQQKLSKRRDDTSLVDAAHALGRRFHYDEGHAIQVRALATALFDDLAPLHRLPAAVRPYLEVAAVLHDIGNSVSYPKHHKHTYYLIQNADLAGLADRERDLVARIARYHRRTPPDLNHSGMEGLTPTEARVVRKCATLLRVADSLDRSHQQPVRKLSATTDGRSVKVKLASSGAIDLELWDAQHEAALFQAVFGKKLVVQAVRARG